MSHLLPAIIVNNENAEQLKEEYSKWLIMELGEPVTITTRESIARSTSFTTYLIRAETNHAAFKEPYSAVRRRYSEFCWLRTHLAQNYPKEILPPLPPKKIFHIVKFNPKVIEERSKGLSLFLQKILQKGTFLYDTALHMFLQSESTIEEIEAVVIEENLKKLPKGYNMLVRQCSCSSAGSASSEESFI